MVGWHHQFSGHELGLEMEYINDQAQVRKPSIKILKLQSWESFRVGKHLEALGRYHFQRGCGSPSPHTCAVRLFHLAVPELNPFILNWYNDMIVYVESHSESTEVILEHIRIKKGTNKVQT